METTNENRYSVEARARKVLAYVRYLSTARDGQGFTAAEVRAFTIEQWSLAAKGCGQHYPSDVSKQMIATMMEGVQAERERDTDDLFSGLGR